MEKHKKFRRKLFYKTLEYLNLIKMLIQHARFYIYEA